MNQASTLSPPRVSASAPQAPPVVGMTSAGWLDLIGVRAAADFGEISRAAFATSMTVVGAAAVGAANATVWPRGFGGSIDATISTGCPQVSQKRSPPASKAPHRVQVRVVLMVNLCPFPKNP